MICERSQQLSSIKLTTRPYIWFARTWDTGASIEYIINMSLKRFERNRIVEHHPLSFSYWLLMLMYVGVFKINTIICFLLSCNEHKYEEIIIIYRLF